MVIMQHHFTYGLALETVKKPNFTAEFTNFLNRLPFKPSPEDVLNYIYAVMYHHIKPIEMPF